MLIEKAAHELINLLLDQEEWKDSPPEQEDSKTSLVVPPSATSTHRSVSIQPGEMAASRRRQLLKEMQQEAGFLLEHFNHQNLNSLLKLTRTSLENLRKRISASSSLGYSDRLDDQRKDHTPVFQASAVLSLPSIVMRPSLDDIQNTINHVVQLILGVHYRVYLWGQDRSVLQSDSSSTSQVAAALPRASKGNVTSTTPRPSAHLTTSKNLKNFHRLVSENKEVAKLVSFLSTTVSSTKRLVTVALEQFQKYRDLWKLDREVTLKEFMSTKPQISEFESEMKRYEELQLKIKEEHDNVLSGSIVIKTGIHIHMYIRMYISLIYSY